MGLRLAALRAAGAPLKLVQLLYMIAVWESDISDTFLIPV